MAVDLKTPPEMVADPSRVVLPRRLQLMEIFAAYQQNLPFLLPSTHAAEFSL